MAEATGSAAADAARAGEALDEAADPVVTSLDELEATYTMRAYGPVRLQGRVVEGFKRGSKLLGFPTANLDPPCFEGLVDDAHVGVYYGFAQVGAGGEVRPAVLSIGYNPVFKNEKLTVETYIIHEFEEDFYGEEMRLIILGYMRPQVAFKGDNVMDLLVRAIKRDVALGAAALADGQPAAAYRNDALFSAAKL